MKKKCIICKKRLNWSQRFDCKCVEYNLSRFLKTNLKEKIIFCNIHKYPFNHDCEYDYKKDNKNSRAIIQQNPSKQENRKQTKS